MLYLPFALQVLPDVMRKMHLPLSMFSVICILLAVLRLELVEHLVVAIAKLRVDQFTVGIGHDVVLNSRAREAGTVHP